MLTLLHLLSAVALLVWGTHIVRTGVMRVFGMDTKDETKTLEIRKRAGMKK